MTMLRLKAELVDETIGEQYTFVQADTDVPPEAGPWNNVGAILDVFKHLVEAIDSRNAMELFCKSLSLYCGDVLIGYFLADWDGPSASTKALSAATEWDS